MLSSYNILILLTTDIENPIFSSTFQTQLKTIQSNAATKSVSAMPHPLFCFEAAKIASLALPMPYLTSYLTPYLTSYLIP